MTVDVDIDIGVFLPAYRHLLESDCDINFLWGSRDSGKSYFIASKLLMDCMQSDYFRCILIKKTHESIKDSQWQMLKDIAEKWGVSHLFEFIQSPLEVRCINGNKFISRGCDNAGKLKSISNPSHAWYEEGNQLSLEDFITASSTLRNDYVRVQQWFSFNPECENLYTDFWLYKAYFIDIPYNEVVYRTTNTLIDGEQVELKYSSTHTDYTANPYVKPERKALIESLQLISPYKYLIYAKGYWSKHEIKRPYVYNFKPDKHVSSTAIYQPNRPIIFSLDFNVEPFACTCSHQWRDNEGEHKHYFKELCIETNGDVHEMCDLMVNTFGKVALANALFTGDAMQRKREITQRGNLDAWRIIDRRFSLGKRLKVPRANPSVKDNRFLMNTLCSFHPDFKFNPEMKRTIFELQFTEVDEDGDLIKGNRKDEKQRADFVDCFIGDTLIKTLQGNKRIDSIIVGDKVLTSDGEKKVIDTWDSIAEVNEYEFSDGTKIQCTKDHKFYTHSFGFYSILDIFEQNISVCKLKKQDAEMLSSSIMAEGISNTQNNHTSIIIERENIIQSHYIGKFGLMLMGKSLKAWIFITKIKTRLIMNWIIMNYFQEKNTRAIMLKRGIEKIQSIYCDLLKSEESLQKYGMAAKQDMNGTRNTHKIFHSGILPTEKNNVSNVGSHSLLKTREEDFATTTANPHGEEKINPIEQKNFVNVGRHLQQINTTHQNIVQRNANQHQTHTDIWVKGVTYKGWQKVYDITVEGGHEFYANDILVHNCVRYDANVFLHDYLDRYKLK